MIPLKTIEELIEKHSSLDKDLSSGERDKTLFAENPLANCSVLL